MFFFSVFCECEQNQKQSQQTVMFAKSSLPEPLIASANSRQLTKKEKKNKIKNIKSSLTVKILQIQTLRFSCFFPFFFSETSSLQHTMFYYCSVFIASPDWFNKMACTAFATFSPLLCPLFKLYTRICTMYIEINDQL